MKKYRCKICDCICIYGASEEKLESSHKEDISVEELPDEWYCLFCHKDKSAFDRNQTKLFAA